MIDGPVEFNPFRVIPCLQVSNGRLVKTTGYRNPSYVGDLINSLRIFNEKEVDEIAVIDVSATREGRAPDLGMIREMAGECFMPLAYGGGITSLAQIEQIVSLGVEKVILNTAAFASPDLITQAAALVGGQSVVVSVDVKKRWLGGYGVYTHSGTKRVPLALPEAIDAVVQAGAGELLLSEISLDGTLQGYNHALIKSVSSRTTIPVIASGGASGIADMVKAVRESGAAAVAAGAFFVYRGPHRAVLLSYPNARDVWAHITETGG
ncbi:MAG: AglZ/HisF2 family acetamidino modification protein [Steroidobacteraceae bacterium]